MNLEEALDKVEHRFIFNLPDSELSQGERLFFQVEQAHWFYEDLLADNNPSLPRFKLKPFAELLFKHCLLLHPLKNELHVLFDEFCSYRLQIPVCGCIMLNSDMTKTVLVRNWKGNSWSFPKGKINEGEAQYDCAIRETYEETGFNPTSYCSADHCLVVYEEKRMTKLFLAVGVPEGTEFCPQTRKEISKVEFHPLSQLPKGIWGVQPFLPKLQRWIRKHRNDPTILANLSGPEVAKSEDGPSGGSTSAPVDGKKAKDKVRGTPGRFDERNNDTFGMGDDGSSQVDKGWSVEDMFFANAKLTGRPYTYDGNPHNFGDTHPRYVDFSQQQARIQGWQGESVIEASTACTRDGASCLSVPKSSGRPIKCRSNMEGSVGGNTGAVHIERKDYFPNNFQFNLADINAALDAALPKTILPRSTRSRGKR